MSQNTHAIGFYIGYFGHMTKYTCMLHRYPCGFVFVMIDKAFSTINGAFHLMALFTFHTNIQVLHLQQIRFLQTSQHEYSTHGYQDSFFLSFGRKSINCHEDFKLATPISGNYSYSCSIIFFNVVDHAKRSNSATS